MSGAGDLFLRGLINNPERLPQAPDHVTYEDSVARIDNGVFCVVCGETAEVAFIAQTSYEDTETGNIRLADSRWLDLCNSCREWVVDGNTAEGYQDEN